MAVSRGTVALLLLLLVAAGHYAWNASTVIPLSGYDAGGHAGYVLTILEEGRLPHPLGGWSTFHPPLYYLIAAALWSALEPFGPRAVLLGLRSISSLSILAAGAVAFILALRLGARTLVAWVAAALVLFMPMAQLAATMQGNEALGAACAALALPSILALQADPRRAHAAALAGLASGLALATKFSGAFVALACFVPFFRSDLDRRAIRALAVGALVGALVAGPIYVRNLVLTGSPLPMTRELEPMRSIEAAYAIRPRRLSDYLSLSPRCLRNPTIFAVSVRNGVISSSVNTAMLSVSGLVHASFWYDPFSARIPMRFHRKGVYIGRLLTVLGIVPTGVLLLGFALALRDLVRSRGRSPESPLVVMCLAGLTAFVAFTWRAPSLVAAKGSYLLPLLVPAALLFARGATHLPELGRRFALGASLAVVLASAVVFTTGLVFPPDTDRNQTEGWKMIGRELPGAWIAEAADFLGTVPAQESSAKRNPAP